MKLVETFVFLLQNVLAGTRMALFFPFRPWSFKGGYGQICLLLLVSISLSFIYDYYDTLPYNYFNPHGLSYQGMLYLMFFFSLSLITYLNKRHKDLENIIIMFLSIVPVIWFGTICLLVLVEQQTFLDEYQSSWAVFILYSFWYLLVVFRIVKHSFQLGLLASFGYVILYGLINFTPLFLLPTQPLFFALPQNDEKAVAPVNIDIESIYYNQPNLIKKAANELLGNREKITDLFFVGFAGDAGEDVFMNEAIAARDLLDSRFDSFGRSALLINNQKTVQQYPLANRYNLSTMLKEVANKMNVEEDILFLFITSHGSEDHSIATDFYPFKLKDLAPGTIKSLLDQAGIKWRIIVVSACYSGGFIEPLADANSLIITAARADRNSFGCGHDGEFTYFGEAYFGQALKQTRSFIDAFELAKSIISKKENDQGFTNSEPQIKIGDGIKTKLTLYSEQLEAKGHNNWASTNEIDQNKELIR